MNNIIVYSASAGSGKTFSLAVEYVCMLMDYIQKGKSLGFRSILAVTFTNASTKEMKDRIIDVLVSLSNKQILLEENENPYLDKIKEKTSLTTEHINYFAQKVLSEIIHNYSFFNIYTIDAFFQLIFRNMAKELGLSSDFSIILDEGEYNTRAVRNIIKQSENKDKHGQQLSNWLYHFFIKKTEENESWNFERDLISSLKSIKNQWEIKALDNPVYQLDNLLQKEKELKKRIKTIKDKAEKYRNDFFEVLAKYNIQKSDFRQNGNREIYPKINNKLTDLNDPYLISKEVEKFYEKNTNYLKTMPSPGELTELIHDMDLFLQENVEKYRSLQLFYKSIYSMGVLKTLYMEKLSLQKENGVFFLSNTKDVLCKLNLQNENSSDIISFIYEKVGNYLEKIMIDEFQDTSLISWQILKPLIDECLALQNGQTFIFGDIKQSIYRWNGGDRELFRSLIEDKTNVVALEQNYRTYGNIVEFYNGLFSYLYGTEYQNQLIREDYKNKGSVVIKFVDKKTSGEREDLMLQATIEEIDFYLDLGYKVEDIAILCRGNKNITTLSHYLKQLDNANKGRYKYNPISDDAFVLSSSEAVNLIISGLKFLLFEKDTLSKEHLFTHNSEVIQKINMLRQTDYKSVSLFDIVVNIADVLKLNDTVFLPALYDAIKKFVNDKQGGIFDFLDYWETTLKSKKVETAIGKNSLRLTTIHKSKGLEYNIVILPYLRQNSWDLYNTKESILLSNDDEQVIDMPLFETKIYQLENTCFSAKYEQEKYMQRTDNYNLLYVAFTRAKKHLSVLAEHSKEIKGEIKNVGDLLYDYLNSRTGDFIQRGEVFVYKNIIPEFYGTKTERNNDIGKNEKRLTDMSFTSNAVVFYSPSAAEEYFKSSLPNDSETKRVFGTNMHNIISMLQNKEDIKKYSPYFAKRYENWEQIKTILFAMFDYAKDRFWFEDKYKVLNERDIICKDDKNKIIVKRPDRIMIGEDKIEVVDYKFAKKDKTTHQRYVTQITEYKQLLSQMGYSNIDTFLWYVDIENQNLIGQEIVAV